MVAVDENGDPVSPTTGQPRTTVVPHVLIERLIRVLGTGSEDLTSLTKSLKHRPDPTRFGGSALGRQLAAKVDGAYDDLLYALDDAVTGLHNYRAGLNVYREGMGNVEDDVVASARRKTAALAVTAGDGCTDDTTATVCTPAATTGEGS